MLSGEEILTRNKIIGVLIRSARLRAGKSVSECAQALSLDPDWLTRAEEGREGVTLPQLESLAHMFRVPLGYLLGEQELLEDPQADRSPPYHEIIILRRKIIGVILRQARHETGRSLDEIAPALGIPPERLARIELGQDEISLVELDMLAEALGISFARFVSEDLLPLTTPERAQRDMDRFMRLPAEVREFVLKPINIPYLQVAMNLSQMPSDTLRQIASGLLEITY
jgi:transcriptional regulator with XRE-family HTH domain